MSQTDAMVFLAVEAVPEPELARGDYVVVNRGQQATEWLVARVRHVPEGSLCTPIDEPEALLPLVRSCRLVPMRSGTSLEALEQLLGVAPPDVDAFLAAVDGHGRPVVRERRPKTCTRCGRAFLPRHQGAWRYCSDACRDRRPA